MACCKRFREETDLDRELVLDCLGKDGAESCIRFREEIDLDRDRESEPLFLIASVCGGGKPSCRSSSCIISLEGSSDTMDATVERSDNG